MFLDFLTFINPVSVFIIHILPQVAKEVKQNQNYFFRRKRLTGLLNYVILRIKDEIIKRVEVKSTKYSGIRKKVAKPQAVREDKHDILAIVLSDKIEYQPLLNEIWKEIK